ncbi:MAG: hypothetical protein M1825_001762 [Sarcosagium campestre]|nr:MAG: hypothetical protein M1825_001762 [Sarcosagium campestre]
MAVQVDVDARAITITTSLADQSPPPDTPILRTSSPSPSASPTPALFACPPLERSVSAASSASTFSARSSTSRSSDVFVARRRGYVRPQATGFAESARNRESVMNLGSIAHVQSYFARTGLLDGKGAQLSREKSRTPSGQSRASSASFKSSTWSHPLLLVSDRDSSYSSMGSSPEPGLLCEHDAYPGSALVESPIEEETETELDFDEDEAIMLPPTVSTYVHRPKQIEPPPDVMQLRKNLRSAVKDAEKMLKDAVESDAQAQGWHELQGVNVIDLMTLAIRAARLYYTAHEQPAKLAAIKPERRLREELLSVMDVLKRMATRNFSGGVRADELRTMQSWLDGVVELIVEEEQREGVELRLQRALPWMGGDWTGRERERELAFLKSSDPKLPDWTAPEEASELPTPFLAEMRDGLRLVQLHNELVHRSKRPFGQIPTFHTDTLKPYRCAENLRYWIKAAELRWGLKFRVPVDVLGVVYGRGEAWKPFDEAIMQWAAQVRAEISEEIRKRTLKSEAERLATVSDQQEQQDVVSNS